MVDASEIDLALLAGFSFRCRPGCGLCCYATPAVSATERSRLLAIEPEARFDRGTGEFSLIRSRPEGGACQFLRENRCTVHAARPFPCRSFPVGVHIGVRLQASLGLHCPGLDLSHLAHWRPGARSAPIGLDEEVSAARGELARRGVPRLMSQAIRRLDRIARRSEFTRDELLGALRTVARRFAERPELDLAGAWRPPDAGGPLESLPVFFDGEHGIVGVESEGTAWNLRPLAEGGGRRPILGSFRTSVDPPGIDSYGEAVWKGYLRYVAERDATLWSILYALPAGADRAQLEAATVEFLRSVGATVIARARLRGSVTRGDAMALGAPEVLEGVRATDAECLDRPTLGAVL
ncbi:MAG TPA: YkgJ family cysteine cluster protein [Thermoplasmata archaeon]|nr:YkgJ family cysteine cluster protein [Thermoplasmata archaeon]